MAYRKAGSMKKARKGRNSRVKSGKRTKTIRARGGSPGSKFQGGGRF